MAKKGMFSRIPINDFSIFTKQFRDISTTSKVFYMYLFSNPRTVMAGIFEVGKTFRSGLTENEIAESIAELSKKGLVLYDNENDIIAVPEMIKINNPKGEKQSTGVINHLENIESFQFWDIVKNYMISIDYNNDVIDYLNTIDNEEDTIYFTLDDTLCDTVSNTLSDTRKKKEDRRKKIETKREKIEIKINKEEKALLEKDAVSVYDYYINNVKVGNRKKSISRLNKILKKKSYSELIVAIDNYKQQKDYEGVTNLKYIKTPENFFSIEDETYDNFLSENWINPYMLKEINELKSKSYNFKNGSWTEFGLNQVNDVKSRYNIVSESAEDKDIIEVTDFKVVGG